MSCIDGCPIAITARLGKIPTSPAVAVPEKVSPVKLKAPLPFATTLAPTWFIVTVKARAGWAQKSDVAAIAKTVSGRSFLAKGFMPDVGAAVRANRSLDKAFMLGN